MAHSADETSESILPPAPVQIFIKPLAHFLHIEASSGIVLIACTLIALFMANSTWSDAYLGFWRTPIGLQVGSYELSHSLKHWINDGLMVIFFFVIGMEVKREIVLGQLRSWQSAALPVFAALGGMIVPALIYVGIEWGRVEARGWGIPMATDIAFVVGCMAILGRRVPPALRVMLLSLAIVDDIGAILVIAFGYTETVNYNWLTMGLIGVAMVVVMQRIGVRNMGVYGIVGLMIWLGFHESGIHATIAGVILGLQTPARAYLSVNLSEKLKARAAKVFHGEDWEMQPLRAATISSHQTIVRETVSPLAYLIYVLHPWVAFVIMPLFALANAGVVIHFSDLFSHVALAVMFGLAVGKPLGILAFCKLATSLGLAQLPPGVSWRQVIGGGFLAGIGFTMALFISGLALVDEPLRAAKLGVLVASLLSAAIGMFLLATAPLAADGVTDSEPPVEPEESLVVGGSV